MSELEFKIWKVVSHPLVRLTLALSWPLAALVGAGAVIKYERMYRVSPIISISVILCCFLALIAVAFRFRLKNYDGVPFMSYLSLMEIGSVVAFAYFSATCIALAVLYRWTFWDILHPQHLLPDPRLYPTANLAYLGLILSLILWAGAWWRKWTSRPL